MSDAITMAQAVASQLSYFHAKVCFAPEYDLRDLEQMKVCVVPIGVEYKTIGRSNREEIIKVQVGFLKRCTEDDLPGLLRETEEIGLSFLNKMLQNAVCVSVAYNPIYSPEHFRERRQFTSVIELAFKKLS